MNKKNRKFQRQIEKLRSENAGLQSEILNLRFEVETEKWARLEAQKRCADIIQKQNIVCLINSFYFKTGWEVFELLLVSS